MPRDPLDYKEGRGDYYRAAGVAESGQSDRMVGPTLERIERRLLLIEASRTLAWITVDQMTRALIHVRLGCEGDNDREQWENTRYYAERLLNHLAQMQRGDQ